MVSNFWPLWTKLLCTVTWSCWEYMFSFLLGNKHQGTGLRGCMVSMYLTLQKTDQLYYFTLSLTTYMNSSCFTTSPILGIFHIFKFYLFQWLWNSMAWHVVLICISLMMLSIFSHSFGHSNIFPSMKYLFRSFIHS